MLTVFLTSIKQLTLVMIVFFFFSLVIFLFIYFYAFENGQFGSNIGPCYKQICAIMEHAITNQLYFTIT